ncbi:DUF4097 family beta strand repeat protein [Streptomyces sp. SID8366]|uniref:DUF4097 family beta strand repeat-containing protein n=1 Tax=unclassified Streptomyces TaxID=2593676 RepID=UPI000DBA0A7B|nr:MULTISPECIES: DUF4097 family beta strand repeat-containing protein [unclassified Streptomyces]MYU03891.1 DUF4097 family beta strand repeat protein [Streptomyces sp. SID8366]MYU62583.1 DUF4097 family beta strand repeat protein [Streptomyces sp. SID69]RAJ49919.1 putative adhesin [Streptomyces sp. PsTaAH-130]
MPAFDTSGPISVTAHVGAGSIRFIASDRPDTVVEVLPGGKRGKDVRAAEQTEVAYVNGELSVRTRERAFIGPSGTVEVTVELPTGSRVDVGGSWVQVFGEGGLGEARVKTSVGDVRLDTAGPLKLTVSHGSISVDRVAGGAEITTSSGSLRVGTVQGSAVLKNSHGSTVVGVVTGELRVNGANGDIDIECAEGDVVATTAHGTLRAAEVVRGRVQLETSYGAIEVGVREGTAAWLDVSSERGHVRNTLTASGAPERSEETVEVRARTRYGSIDVRRARH